MTTHTIRCRLSDGVADAIEFSAQDGPTLAAGCQRAFDRYIERHPHGSTRYRRPVELELQVRPVGSAGDGWFAPVRNRRPVRVVVSAAILEQRAPWSDEWRAIWEWVVANRADDQALGQMLADGSEFGMFDATRDDEADDAE